MSGYALGQAGAEEFERARLALLAKVSDPFTLAQLGAIGVQPGWRCVDVGVGGGAVIRLLAAPSRRNGFGPCAGPGHPAGGAVGR